MGRKAKTKAKMEPQTQAIYDASGNLYQKYTCTLCGKHKSTHKFSRAEITDTSFQAPRCLKCERKKDKRLGLS